MICGRVAISFFSVVILIQNRQSFPLWKLWIFFTLHLPPPLLLLFFFFFGVWKTMGLSFFPGKTVLQETVRWDVSKKLLQTWKFYKCSSCPAKAITSFIFKPLTLKQSTLMTSRRWYHLMLQNKRLDYKIFGTLHQSHPQWKPWGFSRWHSSLSDHSRSGKWL